jgi:hypothetical protein
VRPKPGNIYFSLSLVELGRHNRNLASRVASPHGSSSSSRLRRDPVLRVGRRLDHRAQQLSRDADVLQRHCSAGSRSQLRPSIARASRGDAHPQLLIPSLTFGNIPDHYYAHRFSPTLCHFPSLCKAAQANPMPRCYLSRLSNAEVGFEGGYQLVGGSTQVESSAIHSTE